MKKNILIIAYDGMNKSGVPSVIMEIINGLYNDFNFSLVVFEDIENHFYYSRLKELNIEVIRFNNSKPLNKIKKFFYEYNGFQNATYRFFYSLFKSRHFDCVHSFKEGDSSGVFKAAKKFGIKQRIWHTNVLHKNQRGILGLISRHKLKLTTKYATSFVGVTLLSCQLAFKRKSFSIITNCFNSDTYSFIDAGPFKNLELIQIGYYSDNKNQLFTLNLCKLLLAKFPSLKLHFIGYINDKVYFEKIRETIQKEDLQNNVVLHKFDANQSEIFKNCSYSLMPSKREGFSLTLIEAQACGLKCVASTNIPYDANAGGVTYLDLSPELWANFIIDDFNKYHGKHVYFDMKKYSRESFLKNIKELYD